MQRTYYEWRPTALAVFGDLGAGGIRFGRRLLCERAGWSAVDRFLHSQVWLSIARARPS